MSPPDACVLTTGDLDTNDAWICPEGTLYASSEDCKDHIPSLLAMQLGTPSREMELLRQGWMRIRNGLLDCLTAPTVPQAWTANTWLQQRAHAVT